VAEGDLKPVDQPELPRGTRWAAGRPYASLLVCVGLIAVQVATWGPLFVLGVRYHQNERVTALLQVPMIIWFFLPLGAFYGIHVGMVRQQAPGGRVMRAVGIAANAVYLLLAILIWIAVFSGRLSV
jgi:hypothetical protein